MSSSVRLSPCPRLGSQPTSSSWLSFRSWHRLAPLCRPSTPPFAWLTRSSHGSAAMMTLRPTHPHLCLRYVRTYVVCVCVCVCVCVPVCLRCALYCMQTFLSWLSLLATGTSNPRTRTIVYILITSIWRDMAFQSTDLQ